MKSLKLRNLSGWLKQFKKAQPFWILPLPDGIYATLTYRRGHLLSAQVGEIDITKMARQIQGVIPHTTSQFGEVKTITVGGYIILHTKYLAEETSDFCAYVLARRRHRRDKDVLNKMTFIAMDYSNSSRWGRKMSRYGQLLALGYCGFTTIRNPSRYTRKYSRVLKRNNVYIDHTQWVLMHSYKKRIPDLYREGKPDEQAIQDAFVRFQASGLELQGVLLEPTNPATAEPVYIRSRDLIN